MVWYQLSNLLLYKHELLLSKCPLTADWLLIRPVWNEISNEPVKYDPIPERIISNTHTRSFPPPCPSPVFIFVFLPFTFCLLLPLWLLILCSPCLSSLDLLLLLSLPAFPPCLPECNCSGRSDECVFDTEQYRSTGSGGRCTNCRDNTDGPHCERCLENHYRKSSSDVCLPCNCNVKGRSSKDRTYSDDSFIHRRLNCDVHMKQDLTAGRNQVSEKWNCCNFYSQSWSNLKGILQ